MSSGKSMSRLNAYKKKGQEEMVGFVAIMLVVAIAFLIFLGIYLRKGPSTEVENFEISQFLESSFEVTTDCRLSSTRDPSDMGELIRSCSANSANTCYPSGKEVCDEVKESMMVLIESSWNFNETSPEKGYLFAVKRETNLSDQGIVSFGSSTPPTSNIRSAEKPLPGGIIMYLEIYS